MPRVTAARVGAAESAGRRNRARAGDESTDAPDRTRQFSKTKLCKFEQLGICAKGTSCPFAHGDRELRDLPDLRCTKLCFSMLQTGSCNKASCTFAHSREELRGAGAFHKTKLCRFAQEGCCALGPKCGFAHSTGELRRPERQQQSRGAAAPKLTTAPPPGLGWEDDARDTSAGTGSGSSSSGASTPPPTMPGGFGAELNAFGMCAGMAEEADWLAAFGAGAPWLGGLGCPPFLADGDLREPAYLPAPDNSSLYEPAYVPIRPAGMDVGGFGDFGGGSAYSSEALSLWGEPLLQGGLVIDQSEDAWQVKAAPEGEEPQPVMRPVRTSESTLCTLGDEPPQQA